MNPFKKAFNAICLKTKQNEEIMDNSKAHIHNLIIVDESGSMRHLKKATLSGINETISSIRSAQEEFAETQHHTLTLITFDSDHGKQPVRTIINNRPIAEVKEFSDYYPSTGCTPLYDAIGQSISNLHKLIKHDPNAAAVVTILTDGEENDSQKWTAPALKTLITQLKEEGWTFSYMGAAHNVKEVADLLKIENVVEFSHNQLGAENTWHRERASRHAYYEKMNTMYSEQLTDDEIRLRKQAFAKEYYSPRITPNHISSLHDNEIFVFGSNAAGRHGGGAARQAMHSFGAVWGQGEGLQGQSYAIPTMGSLLELHDAVNRFIIFADCHPELRFLVTRIGCGIAGFTPQQIAPLFRNAIHLENVTLPADFWQALGITHH